MKIIHCLFILAFLIISCGSKKTDVSQQQQINPTTKIERKDSNMKLKSTSFKDGGSIPAKYTCDGKNFSPEISWTEAPEETKSFAIICDDPDAPMGTWVHWVIFNIPANIKELQENTPKDKVLDNGAKQGKNDFGQIGYDGPCPPGGTHRYFFKLYALDQIFDYDPGITKADLLNVIDGHIIAQTQIIGKYSR